MHQCITSFGAGLVGSRSLKKKGFKKWHKLDGLQASIVPRNDKKYAYQQKPGWVYAFRSPKKRGSSDILYIGESAALLKRIFGGYLGGGEGTAGRIHKKLFVKKYITKVEICWCEDKDRKKREKELLREFKPPWNIKKPKKQ